MAKYIRALMLPNGNSVLIALIAQSAAFEEGVGLLNDRGKMIGWIKIHAQDEAARVEHFSRVQAVINGLVNDPHHAVQPDFSFLSQA